MPELDTADDDEPRVIPRYVLQRKEKYRAAMSRRAQIKKFLQSVTPCCFFWEDTTSNSATLRNEKENSKDNVPQYTVRRRKTTRTIPSRIYNAIKHFCCFGSVVSLQNVNTKSKFGWLPNPNRSLIDFLNWMYRTSFFLLFTSFAIFFYVLCLIFGVLIMWSGRNEPECISIGDKTYGGLSGGAGFAGAFTLSWTTLSTVGYGNVAPSVDGTDSKDLRDCVSINFLLMLEAFFGVIYAGFCGAILFGKVLRFQSKAPVVFSDPIVIRVSNAIVTQCGDKNESARNRELVDPPILEFRLVNLLHDEQAGEIIGASLQVVASKNADDTDPEVLESSNRERFKSINQQTLKAIKSDKSGDNQDLELSASFGQRSIEFSADESDDRVKPKKSKFKKALENSAFLSSVNSTHGGNRDKIPKTIFSNIEIQEPKHPLFKHAWVGQHVLDETSPLLKDKVKSRIKKNQGLWPKSLCKAIKIKKCLDFNQIIVSINGVSNVTGTGVYAHRIYDFKDVVVGYEFVDILLQESNGAIKLDMGGLHCVVGQFGKQFNEYMDCLDESEEK